MERDRLSETIGDLEVLQELLEEEGAATAAYLLSGCLADLRALRDPASGTEVDPARTRMDLQQDRRLEPRLLPGGRRKRAPFARMTADESEQRVVRVLHSGLGWFRVSEYTVRHYGDNTEEEAYWYGVFSKQLPRLEQQGLVERRNVRSAAPGCRYEWRLTEAGRLYAADLSTKVGTRLRAV